MNDLEVPEYNNKETVNQYMKRVEKYKIQLLQSKYDVILNFVNDWTENKYEALSEFKNIQEKILLKNNKHNRDIVRKYSDIFRDKFDIDLSFDMETDSDEINDKYIIYLLMKMLVLINYTLSKKEFNNKLLYTIRKK